MIHALNAVVIHVSHSCVQCGAAAKKKKGGGGGGAPAEEESPLPPKKKKKGGSSSEPAVVQVPSAQGTSTRPTRERKKPSK